MTPETVLGKRSRSRSDQTAEDLIDSANTLTTTLEAIVPTEATKKTKVARFTPSSTSNGTTQPLPDAYPSANICSLTVKHMIPPQIASHLAQPDLTNPHVAAEHHFRITAYTKYTIQFRRAAWALTKQSLRRRSVGVEEWSTEFLDGVESSQGLNLDGLAMRRRTVLLRKAGLEDDKIFLDGQEPNLWKKDDGEWRALLRKYVLSKEDGGSWIMD